MASPLLAASCALSPTGMGGGFELSDDAIVSASMSASSAAPIRQARGLPEWSHRAESQSGAAERSCNHQLHSEPSCPLPRALSNHSTPGKPVAPTQGTRGVHGAAVGTSEGPMETLAHKLPFSWHSYLSDAASFPFSGLDVGGRLRKSPEGSQASDENFEHGYSGEAKFRADMPLVDELLLYPWPSSPTQGVAEPLHAEPQLSPL